jgi:enediyne biosynthesis protein E4
MRKKIFLIHIIFFLIGHLPFLNAQNVPLFTTIPSLESGITFDNKLVESPENNIITYEYFYNGGGTAVADFNNDGLMDIYFTSNQQPNQLYFNKGNWKFENVTALAGVAGKAGWKTGVSVADVNADGWVDIYVCYSGDFAPKDRQNQLFINNGNGTFTDKALEMGVADDGLTTHAAFFDFDKDGDLDLFVLNHNIKNLKNFDAAFVKKMIDADAGDRLYQNNQGKFIDITQKAGILSNPLGYGLGVNISDINNDGWPDIYVTNDYIEEDYLYINQKDGTFKESLKEHLGHISNFSMGVDIADINNDGLQDIITLDMLPETNKRQKLLYTPDNYELYENAVQNGFYHQIMRNMLQLNNGDGTFSEIGQLAGVSNTDWSWAALLADFNNDGFRDLFVSNGYGRDMINMDFMKFYANERLKHNRGEASSRMFLMLQSIKSTPLHNYIFENNGRLQFTDRSVEWGFASEDFSHGAAYADFDNDGDLDLVVNRMNQTAGLFRNNSIETYKNRHFLQISLKMEGNNRNALGARVKVYTADGVQLLENYPVHGFQSSMLTPLQVGFLTNKIDSLQVIWPDGGLQSVTQNIGIDHLLTLEYKKFAPAIKAKHTKPVFSIIDQKIPFEHLEDKVNDFKIQPLMPNMLSYSGPHIATSDLNKDGKIDFYIGGARNQSGEILIQQTEGQWLAQKQTGIEADKGAEDTDAVFFDADQDGDQDLYVVSGGFDLEAKNALLQDRLYFNEKGIFIKNENALPIETFAGSCVVTLDFDKDNDLDLFIGTRVVPGEYPKTPENILLQNDGKGVFKNVTATLAPDLQFIGMTTDATWEDLDKDGKKELLVAGEWMNLQVFAWKNGQMTNQSDRFFEKKLNGWWNCLQLSDMDKDGDLDLIVGNWGTNSQYKATPKEPLTLTYGDFDKNGFIEPFLCQYNQEISYPLASRDEMTDQMVSLRQLFPTYDAYSEATLVDILSPEQLAESTKLQVNHLETTYFENKNGLFIAQSLPVEANFAPVFAIASDDFDHDGNLDILLGGNVEHTRIKIGKMDANHGTLLRGDGKGGFQYVPQLLSGLSIQGCVRDIQVISSGKMILGVNDGKPVILGY